MNPAATRQLAEKLLSIALAAALAALAAALAALWRSAWGPDARIAAIAIGLLLAVRGGLGVASLRLRRGWLVAGLSALLALAALGAVQLTPLLLGLLRQRFLLDPLGLGVLQVLLVGVGTLPVGAAAGVILRFLQHGAEPATLLREWLTGASAGLAAGAGVLIFGVGALALAVGSAAAVVVLCLWVRGPAAGEGPKPPARSLVPAHALKRTIVVLGGVLGVAAVLQLRALEALHRTPGERVGWFALTGLVIAALLRRADARSAPGLPGVIGLVVGGLCGVGFQYAEAFLGVAGADAGQWGRFGVGIALAGATQLPLAALAALAISRSRRRFVEGGGDAPGWLAHASLGAAVAAPAALNEHLLAGFTLLTAAGALLWALWTVRRRFSGRVALAWAGWTLLLAAATAGALYAVLG